MYSITVYLMIRILLLLLEKSRTVNVIADTNFDGTEGSRQKQFYHHLFRMHVLKANALYISMQLSLSISYHYGNNTKTAYDMKIWAT